MRISKHTIIGEIKNSDKYFIVNLLTGNADIIDDYHYKFLEDIRCGDSVCDLDLLQEMVDKGYLMEDKEELKLYRNKYYDFVDASAKEEIQLFFVPSYTCNFSCSYCYQDEYPSHSGALSKDVIDSFFIYVNKMFEGRNKYITLFGGEPLRNSQNHKEMVGYFVSKSAENNIDLCVVTNGYYLSEYLDILKKAKIREVQVTLDGVGQVHDSRRFLKGGKASFDKIVKGIDACLNNQIAINLRMVVDKENISDLPELARFAIEKNWTQNPLFKTQIGRNYELHHCQKGNDNLFDRISLYQEIYNLINSNPHILQFYQPAFSISKFLFENGELPDPLFDSCPACKSEWAFDYTGKIYSCTATVGKKGEELGVYFPEISVDNEKVDEWIDRDVTEIEKCIDCNLQLACGGGCGSVAKNENGKIATADCRPVRELIGLGFSFYFKNMIN